MSIEEVSLGVDCGCTCPGCGDRLIAKNRDFAGRKIQKHFAHDAGTVCPGARESALHLLAKQVVADGKCVSVPVVGLFDFGADCWRVFRAAEIIEFDQIATEKGIDGFRPDVTGMRGEETVMIEICVTHAVDNSKWRAAVGKNWTMLEIDVAHFLAVDFSTDTIREFLFHSVEHRRWIHHAGAAELRSRLSRFADFLLTGDLCPMSLGVVPGFGFSADYSAAVWERSDRTSPCDQCEFCLRADPGGVLCSGRSFLGSIDSLVQLEGGHECHEPAWVATSRAERELAVARAEISVQQTQFARVSGGLMEAPRRWIDAKRGRLRQLSNRMNVAVKRGAPNLSGGDDDAWRIPFMELTANRSYEPASPRALNGRPARLRPMYFKKSVVSAVAKNMTEAVAAEFGLYWDQDCATWIFLSTGGCEVSGERFVYETVPVGVRPLLEVAAAWQPVYPEERGRLRGAQAPPRTPVTVSDSASFLTEATVVESDLAKGISPSPPPVLVADQVIALNVGLCRMCGAPLDRIRVGDGFYAGREALRCRTNGRHPFILISDAEAPRAP